MNITHAVVQPTLGTVEALVATGDLTVIRDDALRAELPNYLKRMAAFEEFEANGSRAFSQARNELRRHVDTRLLRIERLSRAERDSIAMANVTSAMPPGALRDLASPDLVAMIYDPEVHLLLVEMWIGVSTMSTNRDRMRTTTETLMDMVRVAKGDQTGQGAR